MCPRPTVTLVAFYAIVSAACTGEGASTGTALDATGGARSSGGSPATGGVVATDGGAALTGGVRSSGGSRATGGARTADGGATLTGGRESNAGERGADGGDAGAEGGASFGASAGRGPASFGGADRGGSAGTAGTADTSGTSPDVCALPFEPGSCDGALDVFTFDAATGRCEPATWGGCGGNGNRFLTARDCYDTCAPRSCGPTTLPSSPGPYSVRFDIDIAMTESYFTRNLCTLPDYAIYSCADGFTEPLVTASVCWVPCGSEGCPVCGACPDPEPRPITTSVEWSGNQLVSGTPQDNCDCYDVIAAPAGDYLVKVPYFRTVGGVLEDEPAYECSVPFQLPDPDGVVEVVLNGVGADCVRLAR